MERGGEIEAHDLEFQKLEEVFEDRDGAFFYTIFSFGPIYQFKTKLQAFKDQGINLHSVY